MTKNKSKPIALLGLALVAGTMSQAQTMQVKQSNGTQTAYALSTVGKLTFSSGKVTVNNTDNTTGTYALSDLSNLNFKQLTVGVEDQTLDTEKFSLSTYPNPVGEVVNIEVSGNDTKHASISIISIEGKVLLTEPVNGKKNISLNLSQLPQGLYVCQYKTDQTVKTTKLIKH